MNNGLQSCDADGRWGEAERCLDGARCVANAAGDAECVPPEPPAECERGETRCMNNGLQSCDADGRWGEAERCLDGARCVANDAGDAECQQEAVEPFTRAEVQRRFNGQCSGCHGGAGGWSVGADFTRTTFGVASRQAPDMPLINPGDHASSYLWHKIAGTGNRGRMPRFGPYWNDVDIARLAAYIDGLGR